MNFKSILIASAVAVAAAGTAIAQNPGAPCCMTPQQKCAPACPVDSCGPLLYCGNFEGITLTDAQKQKLQAIAPVKAPKAREKAGKDGRKRDFAKGKRAPGADSTAVAARKQARAEYLAKVKSVLTPEQYTKFLENNFTNPAPAFKRGGKEKAKGDFRANRPGRGDRRGHNHGPRK